LAAILGSSFRPDMVAGHSLGEFSALVANETLTFKTVLSSIKKGIVNAEACEKTLQPWQQFSVWK